MSRSFGDLDYKNKETLGESLVSSVPDIRTFEITEETEMIVLACDGIWLVIILCICFVLFCFVLFCFALLFCFVLFHLISFYFPLFFLFY